MCSEDLSAKIGSDEVNGKSMRNRIMKGSIPAVFLLFVITSSALLGKASEGKDDIERIINAAARRHRIEASLIHAIVRTESNYNQRAVSPKGAVGLMQLMPATAAEYGVENIFNPSQNVEGGIRYLKDLIKLYNGKTDLVLAAYNAGQEAVKKYGGIPPFPETKSYIESVKKSGYPKSRIMTRTAIYSFYDKEGRLILTNDRNFYLAHKSNNR